MSFQRINQFKVDINNFNIIREINKGTFGIVYEVEEKSTGDRYAAKVIMTDNSKQEQEMINREVQIMIRVVHPTLIGFHGFSTKDFTGSRNITIIMDLIKNGSLEEILNKVQRSLADSKYDNTARQIILVGIAYGMMSLHQNYVIHRDLKPGNILIDANFYPHITDFGLSKFIRSGHSKSQSKSCGTPIYMAPEVIEGERYDGKADVYSFGIIMYQIVTDTLPYPLFESGKMNDFKLNQKVVNENYRPSFTVPVKKALKKLIERCWAKDPKERPTFEEIFNRLAYNRENSIYGLLEEEEEENDDETPYYLNDVEVDELFMYLDLITNNLNMNENDDSKVLIEKLTKTVEEQQKLMLKLHEENSIQKEQLKQQQDLIQQQVERIDYQEYLLQKHDEQFNMLEKQIQQLNEQIDNKKNMNEEEIIIYEFIRLE